MSKSLDEIRQLCNVLIDKLIDCLRKAVIIKKFLFTQNSFEKKHDSWKVAFIQIRASLFNDYINSIANLLSDRDSRSLSLSNLYDMVFATKGIEKQLEREYQIVKPVNAVIVGNVDSKISENIHKQIENDILQSQQKKFKMLWPLLKQEVADLLESDISKKIYTYRCKIVAHYEINPSGLQQALVRPDEIKMKWNDPFALLEKAEGLILQFYLLLNNASFLLDNYKKSWEEIADEFYSSLASS